MRKTTLDGKMLSVSLSGGRHLSDNQIQCNANAPCTSPTKAARKAIGRSATRSGGPCSPILDSSVNLPSQNFFDLLTVPVAIAMHRITIYIWSRC